MRLSNKVAKLIFTATAVTLLLISYILYQQIKSLLIAQEQLNETNIVKLNLEETLSTLKDAETAQRGFLLTHDSAFLQPYYGAYDRSKQLLSEVRTQIKDSTLKDLNALQTFIELRFNIFNQIIEDYNNPDINAETKKMHLLRSVSVMDNIKQSILNIQRNEDELVAYREKEKRKHLTLTPLFAVLLMATAIGILIFSYGKIIEQLNRTKRLLYRLRKLNNKLKSKNHQLELYNKELDSFTYIVSHDLKEPLRKILTYSTLIEVSDYELLSETGKVHFKRVKHSAQRMKNLLNDLLVYSHVSAEEKQLFEEVDLNKIVEDVIYDLNEEIRETNAHIHASALPVIKGLPFQIKQLFENLIANSIKYRQQQLEPNITIESTLLDKKEIKERFPKESRKYCKLSLMDNGLGFEQSYEEKIFQLFKRLHTNHAQPGTGIGLTICKKIIDNHHGFIKARSEVNKGTTFEIYLPVE